ncbi:MAG: replicative DNA helicase [Selenomonadaceae bacterium]|nr:replicative DNA helicase [Selenomonadaceae bacterium]
MELELIGMLLLKEGMIIPTISAILKAEDFFREEHKILYDTILNLYVRKITPNMLTITEELRRTGELDKVGYSLVLSLGEVAFTTAYAENYAQTIKEKSSLRQLIKAGEEIIDEAYDDSKPVEEILDSAEKKIFSVTAKSGGTEMEIIQPILKRSFEKIQLAVENKGLPTGVSSGFTDFDKVTSGLQKSDLILIAARPSMGKTAFALNLGLNAAKKNNVVAIFSLEMSKEQIGHRLLSSHSGIDSLKLNTGNLTEDEIVEIAGTVDLLSGLKLFIDDTAAISILELRSKARRLKNERGLDLIIIDYLQLMQGGKSSRGTEFNRQQEISEISRSLKALARELKVPVVALSQLSRNVELRADKRPLLSDLRESGSLEQDADIVIFLYREEYYNHETENVNMAEIIIAKNRNGPTSSMKLQFQRECMRFGNLAYGAEE